MPAVNKSAVFETVGLNLKPEDELELINSTNWNVCTKESREKLA